MKNNFGLGKGLLGKRLLFSLFIFLFLFASINHALAQVAYDDEGIEIPSPTKSPKQLKPSIDLSTGAFSYVYDFEIPKGVNGLSPEVRLSYNSQNTANDSVVGYGWNLAVPYISVNNKHGSEKMYTGAYKDFVSSMFGELANSTGTTYIPKSADDIVSLNFVNNIWTYKDNAGTTYTFGTAAASRQDNPGNAANIYKWMLDSVKDANGNVITYTYYKNQGAIYLDQISYANLFSVKFSREANPFPVTVAYQGFRVITAYRINAVTVKAGTANRYVYNIVYKLGSNAQRSLISTITQTGYSASGVAKSLPATVFNYKTSVGPWNSSTTFTTNTNDPVDFEWGWTQLSDVNGDGLLDLVRGSGSPVKTWLNNGSGWTLTPTFTTTESLNFNKGTVQLADVNGDGLPDIIKSNTSTFDPITGSKAHVWLNTGTKWVLSSTFTSSDPINFEWGWTQLSDVNGDGLLDLVRGSGSPLKTQINTGSGWVVSTTFKTEGSFNFNKGTVQLVDVNGDNLPDIISSSTSTFDPITGSSAKVWLNNGSTWVSTPSFTSSNPINFEWGWTQMGDVNNDGLVDIVRASDAALKTMLNTGSGWVLSTTHATPMMNFAKGKVQLSDVNGDGLLDLVRGTGSAKVWLNTGTTWIESTTYTSTDTVNFDKGLSKIADLNGDGLPDFVRATGGKPKVSLNTGNKSDYLASVTLPQGGSLEMTYAEKTILDRNTNINSRPQNVQVVSSLKEIDGRGNSSTTAYDYQDGKFLFFTNGEPYKFAGFEKVTSTRPDGNKQMDYYHQGNASNSANYEYSDNLGKMGHAYRTDVTNSSGVLQSRSTTKWENASPVANTYFVFPSQTIDETFTGTTTAVASTYAFDTAKGNLTSKTEWGSVTASTPLNFTDTGNDKVTTNYSYATNGQGVFKVSNETATDQSGNKVRESINYYDNQTLGVLTLGNSTKTENWKSGSTYINTQRTYNAQGLVTSSKDERGNLTSFVYDSNNLYPVSSTNALNQTTTFVYDVAIGKPTQITDINGLVYMMVYDGLGRVTEQREPDLTTPTTLVTKTAFVYTDTANQVSIKKTDHLDATNLVDTYQYFDGLGRLIQERKEAETGFNIRDIAYNNMGQVQKESLAYNGSGSAKTNPTSTSALYVNYTYDVLSRVLNISNATGTTSHAYDGLKTTVTDSNGKIKIYHKDTYGNLIQVDEKNGSATYTTNYVWNPNNKLIKLTDASSNVRNFTYDGLGRRLTAEDLHASGDSTFGIWTYTYDDAGNIITTLDPKGQVINSTFDALNRQLTEDFAGAAGVEVTYTYDAGAYGKGHLTNTVSPSITQTNTYDPAGSIKTESKVIKGNTFNIGYEYDRQENLLTILNRDSSQNKYVYNLAGQLTQVQTKENSASTFTNVVTDLDYAPTGEISKITHGNGMVTNNTYDPAKLYRLTRKVTGNGSTTVQDLSYTYDSVGNITRIVDASQTSAAKTANYTYDDLHRLTQAAITNSALGQTDYTEDYSYDAIGNITSKPGQGSYSYAGNTGSNFANPHAVTGIGSNALVYDKNGNLISETGKTLTWDYRNRMTKHVTAAAGTQPAKTITTTYDPSGQRLTYSDGAVTTYYPSMFFNKETTGKTVKHIFAGDLLVASVTYPSSPSASTITYIHTDHLGGSNVATDASGNIIETTDYSPYGSIRLDEKTGTFDEQRKFAGSEFDVDTELNYMNARYYSGNTAKFLSQDVAYLAVGNSNSLQYITGLSQQEYLSDPQSQNSYAYARNNPLNLIDLSGNYVRNPSTGYPGAKGLGLMTLENAGGIVRAYLKVTLYSPQIDKYKQNSNIIKSIIFEEQSHGHDDIYSDTRSGSTVGLGQIRVGDKRSELGYSNLSREQLLKAEVNIKEINTRVDSIKNQLEKHKIQPNDKNYVAYVASAYNSQSSIGEITDYGRRVQAYHGDYKSGNPVVPTNTISNKVKSFFSQKKDVKK